jgi:hypothetical protein
MKRSIFAAILTVVVVAPASADVTIRSTIAGKGMGMSGTMTSVTYVKGSKMRNEVTVGDNTRVTIFDLDAQKMTSFDLKKK